MVTEERFNQISSLNLSFLLQDILGRRYPMQVLAGTQGLYLAVKAHNAEIVDRRGLSSCLLFSLNHSRVSHICLPIRATLGQDSRRPDRDAEVAQEWYQIGQ